MKKTILKQDRRGFTLAELLAVFLILVILIGLGVPGFIALRKNIKIAEYDDIAREIYLAAQNQLTRLSANGMDKETGETLSAPGLEIPFTEQPSDFDPSTGVTWDSTEYRHASQGTDCMTLLLPLGGVSEDIRTNGFYTIEYNVSTYTVYGVFYSEKAFNYYDDVDDSGFRTSRDVRKGPMVGYYGGSAVRQNPQNYCQTPQLEIINNNELRLNIKNVPADIVHDGINITISDGTNTVTVQKEKIVQVVAENGYTVLMDSILEADSHFHQLFPGLTPGKDLDITVTFTKDGALPSSASISANSLFATRETTDDPDKDIVTIAWARHLQNLEHSVSDLSDPAITIARQTDHIQWIQEKFGDFTSIRNQNGATAYNPGLLCYEGKNLEIWDLTGENGLFAETKADMQLTGIRLVNPKIDALAANTEPVGALVGTAKQGTLISSCGVYYSKQKADDTVDYDAYPSLGIHNKSNSLTGGLVGQAEGITVNSSFAALPVIEAEKGAGLIGEASNCTITNSYSNCDDLPTSNFQYFIGGESNTVKNSYAVGNVESDKRGDFAKNNNSVTDSYYAVSHKDMENNKDLAATEFYYKEDGSWKKTNQEGMKNSTDPDGWASGWKKLTAPVTHPYRESLDGRAYPYPAIADISLGAMDHYGSWPEDDGTVKITVNMEVLNSDVSPKEAGRVIVTIPGEDGDPETIYDSDDPENFPTNELNVAPGTAITVKATEKDGFEYVHTHVPQNGTSNLPENAYTINRDTAITVRYRQKAFELRCHYAQDPKGTLFDSAVYYVDLTGRTMIVRNSGSSQPMTRDVETGSKIVVRPNPPQGSPATVVYYEVNGSRTYITEGEDRRFTFHMPAADTDLYVIHTDKVATYQIQYHLMEPDGIYKKVGTPEEYRYAIGAQINQDMISAMADSSGLPLTIDGEQVRYLARGVVTKGGSNVFETTIDSEGNVNATTPYVTKDGDEKDPFVVDIFIARRKYNVTLNAGDNIDGVRFSDQPSTRKTVTKEFYYGATVTAVAEEKLGYKLTYWDPRDTRFMMSANKEYTFTMPHFDLNLTANAQLGKYLVTVHLEEDDESWLFSSASRQADPIHLTLVSTKDDKEYPMNALTEDSISYAMQAVVPSIPDLGKGYEIRVDYENSKRETWVFASEGEDDDDNSNEKLLVQVRDSAVEKTAKFYSVTYHANREYYRGAPPKGGTFPMYYHLTVEGNSGYLRDAAEKDPRFFSGWKDYEAEGTGATTIFTGDEILTIIRRTDMFAQWGSELKVRYDGNGADGGTLPVDRNNYVPTALVNVQFGDLTRKGYRFLGWSTDREAKDPMYSQEGTKQFPMGSGNVTLYAVWQLEEYSLKFYDHEGKLLTDPEHTITDKHYGDTLTVPGLTVTLPDGTEKDIVGWSLTLGGDVAYHVGDTVTVTGDMDLYACLAENTVTVTYKSWDDEEEYGNQTFGLGIPSYLNFVPTGKDGKPAPVVAWSTEPEGQGTLYLCRDDGRSEDAFAFTEDKTLYAVYGKVYNYQQRMWFDTLGDAVRSDATTDGHTLIVYRNTVEPHSIWLNKSLSVISSGNRTVKWMDDATSSPGVKLKDEKPTNEWDDKKELVGCMNVSNNGNEVTVSFGKSDVSTLSMDGSTLIFDANKQSRVISLGNKATFHMYDGVTLTNGRRDGKRTDNGNDKPGNRAGYGGGVYAGAGAVFYMHGGTISYCEAVSGGGVYLFTGSKMYMGDMVKPTAYSATRKYYQQNHIVYPTEDNMDPEDVYQNVEGVTAENYKQYWVTAGNPRICYNTATHDLPNAETSSPDYDHADGGGGLLMFDLNNGELTLFCGSINNNKAYANGGGIVTDSKSNKCFLRIYEVDISHNTAVGHGGGIFQWQGTVYVYNSTIRQNEAKRGGGIHLHQTGSETCNIEFYFGDISDNYAEYGGGVSAQNKAEFLISGGNLLRNTAAKGGGAFLGGSSKLNFKQGRLSGNKAISMENVDDGGNGGGVYAEGTVTMTGGTFSDNTAQNYAGGIYNRGTVTISGGVLCDNSATYLGGGIYSNGKLNLSGGSLYGNTDTDYKDAEGDEDNRTESPNDIYLAEWKTITVPDKGIALDGEYRVTVDCDNDDTIRFPGKLPRKIVDYENQDNYKPEDALYFTYCGTRSTELYKEQNPSGQDLYVLSHEDLADAGQTGLNTGLYVAVNPEGDTRTVTLNANFGEQPDVQREGTVGETIFLQNKDGTPVFTRPGYYIAGWARTRDALEEDYVMLYDPVSEMWSHGYQPGTGTWENKTHDPGYVVQDYFSQTLYAMWKPCVVIYELSQDAIDHGVHIEPYSVGPSVTLMNPEPVEYDTADGITRRFKGWSTNPEGENVHYEVTKRLDLTENLRLYDVWEERPKDTVFVTLWYNGGSSGTAGELGKVYPVAKGTGGVTLPNAEDGELTITASGRYLLGWSSDKNATVPEHTSGTLLQNLESDVTLYAVWTDAVELTFDPNYSDAQPTKKILAKGDTYTIKAEDTPARKYGIFQGWATVPEPVDTTTLYNVNSPFGPVDADTTLYAIWEIERWTVTLHRNDDSEEMVEISAEKGTPITLVPPEERDGYTFKGWSTTADGTGSQYEADSPVAYDDAFRDCLNLYAVWEEVTPEVDPSTATEAPTDPQDETPEGPETDPADAAAPSEPDPTDPPETVPTEDQLSEPPETEPLETEPAAETAPEAVPAPEPAAEPPKPSEPELEPEPDPPSEPDPPTEPTPEPTTTP